MGKLYIHYGSNKFDIKKFHPIRNVQLFAKPYGGLWASPIDSPMNWENWCKRENFHLSALKQNFTFRIRPDSKILYINNTKILDSLPKVKALSGFEEFQAWDCLDFEELSKEYCAIEISLSQEERNDCDFWKSLYHRLYGWDCDSILIMDPNCMILEKSQKV